MTLEGIALELLNKYADAREQVINEFSCEIDKAEDELKKEIDEYKKKIVVATKEKTSFGYQPSDAPSMIPKPPSSGSNIVKL